MGRIKLALYTQNERYAGAFSEYCCKNEKERLTVRKYTNAESLKKDISKGIIDFILTDEIPENEELSECGCHVAMLYEDRYAMGTSCAVIYKFQRMDEIIKQVYQIIADGREECVAVQRAGGQGPHFIGCFSPCYEEIREQYARALAEYKGMEGRTLFVNFGMFTAYDNMGEDGLSELLYYAAGEVGAITYKLPALVQNMGDYYALPGVSNYIDLYDLEGNVASGLLVSLESMIEYKTIIIDVGVIGDLADDILSYCSEVIMPIPCDADNRRLTHLKNDYAKSNSSIMDGIRQLRLPEWWDHKVQDRVRWVSERYE